MFLFARSSRAAAAALVFAACTQGDGTQASSSKEPPFYPMSTKSEEAKKYIEEGERAFARGFFADGYRAFKRAAAADSAYGYAYLRIAQTSNSLDEYRTSLARAAAYRSTANEIEQALIDHEKKFFDRDVGDALSIVENLVRKHPENARLVAYLAFIQSGNGKVAEAETNAERAVQLAPQSGEMHLAAAQYYTFTNRNLSKAEEHVQAGLKLWPNEPYSYDVLGDLRRAQNRLEEAAAAYTKQIELNSVTDEGYGQRAHVYAFLGKYDEARADYDEAIRRGKDNSPSTHARYRAYIHAYAGNPKEAIRELKELAIAVDGMGIPDPEGQKIETLYSILPIALLSGLPDAADSAYREIRAITEAAITRVGTPEFRRSQEGRLTMIEARILARRKDYAGAERKIEESMKIIEAERNPTKYWDAYFLRGVIAFDQKRHADALSHFDQTDPTNIVMTYFRGLTLDEMGRKDEAKALFRQVASFNFNQPAYSAIRADAVRRAQ